MASFNCTSVYLNTKSSKTHKLPSIYRVPVSQVNESYYFNQDSIKVIVYYCAGSSSNTVNYKESLTASIHLTNKRLILLSQSTSIAPTKPNYFDTCEFQLSDFQSLKTKSTYKKGLQLDIKTIRNENIKIDIAFNNKKDANRRESLKEYIKMATSAMLADRVRNVGTAQQPTAWTQDDLPSYREATTNANTIAPPAYS
ncbi:hypothetical protein HPULCUR_009882 [Helicostylum pulchrum]|uniref:Uncharacterized protein n=1 Tax=Helicostylum pulchrum TaxID=562976 RepID=A0ABP9YBS2_9FUNG